MGAVQLRGEGGVVFTFDLPLPEHIEQRLAVGRLTRIDGESPAPANRPAQAAPKADWVAWAVQAHGLAADDAEAMTKSDLQELPDAPAAEESTDEAEE